jgi:arylsulfatase A-like enzyme
MAIKEYKPGTTFPGRMGRTIGESEPAWPSPLRAREGAPNVLFIVIDDTGFGQLGCYGSPISTPNIDKLAKNGLLFNNMHTTALCSPSRSCILTGRNHHSNAMSCITEGSTGFPGGNGAIPFENGFLSEMLLQQGYATYAIGKWHLTPSEQISAAGPYDRWPLGRGFERYYGFLGGDTHQYYPDLVYDNHQVEPPKTPEEGYHLTADLADKAIDFIADLKQVAPDKPFFLYFAPGANHAPHHVGKEWSDKYEGKFDEGWDVYREKTFARQKELGVMPKDAKLSRHDPDVQEWAKLPADERKLYARMMEVFAGFCEHMDHHVGRLVDFLEEMGELDNTLIMFISDNGASSEGGPKLYRDRIVEENRPTRAQMRRALLEVEEALVLVTEVLASSWIREFLDASSNGSIVDPARLTRALEDLQDRATQARADLETQAGVTKPGPGKARPEKMSPHTLCVIMIREAWKHVHEAEPKLKSRRAAEAAEAYWLAASGEPRSSGEEPLAFWRHHFKKAAASRAEDFRAEWRRHLHEAERRWARRNSISNAA